MNHASFVLFSAGYNPCDDVYCGTGECVVTELPSPLKPTFPVLAYDTYCLCADNSLRPANDSCILGQFLPITVASSVTSCL